MNAKMLQTLWVRESGDCSGSDDAEQPENQDQDKKSTKTDIHDFSPMLAFILNGEQCFVVPLVTAQQEFFWYHFTRLESRGFA